jgi:hypothetical protein
VTFSRMINSETIPRIEDERCSVLAGHADLAGVLQHTMSPISTWHEPCINRAGLCI